MAKSRIAKQQTLETLTDLFGRMQSAVFLSVSGYTMEDANMLRAKGHEQGVVVTMAKKTLLARALKSHGIEVSEEALSGSILTAIGLNDIVAPAKLLSDFAKGRDGLVVAGGVLEGKMVNALQVKTLSTLPSREELLGRLVGSINAPVSGFVQVLSGNLRGLVGVLSAIKETKSA